MTITKVLLRNHINILHEYPFELGLFDQMHPPIKMTNENVMELLEDHAPVFVEQE